MLQDAYYAIWDQMNVVDNSDIVTNIDVAHKFFSMVAALCDGYNGAAHRWNWTGGIPSQNSAIAELNRLGINGTELYKKINEQHSNSIALKDFAHEAVAIAIFAHGEKPDWKRNLVDIFNEGYTNYESSFKGDIDSAGGQDLTRDFLSDIDAINIYEQIKDSDDPFYTFVSYNTLVFEGEINRSNLFLENIGSGDIGVGIINLFDILDAETMGSQYIQSDRRPADIEEAEQAFIYLVFDGIEID